jgi:hypothetical protein
MQARIYRRSKTAMQSGRGKTHSWVLEYEPATPRRPEPLMGWVASGDTLNQVQLAFPTREEAVAFAERKGVPYSVMTEQERATTPTISAPGRGDHAASLAGAPASGRTGVPHPSGTGLVSEICQDDDPVAQQDRAPAF